MRFSHSPDGRFFIDDVKVPYETYENMIRVCDRSGVPVEKEAFEAPLECPACKVVEIYPWECPCCGVKQMYQGNGFSKQGDKVLENCYDCRTTITLVLHAKYFIAPEPPNACLHPDEKSFHKGGE